MLGLSHRKIDFYGKFHAKRIKPNLPSVTVVCPQIAKQWVIWVASGDLRGSGRKSLVNVPANKWVRTRESPIWHMELPSGAGEI